MGSEIKHTPGEWHAAGWSSNGTPIIAQGDESAFHVAVAHTPMHGWNRRVVTAEDAVIEGKANAALIAAAPELLQSLKEACDSFAVLAADFDALAATGNDYAKKAAASARNMEAAYRAAITKATA